MSNPHSPPPHVPTKHWEHSSSRDADPYLLYTDPDSAFPDKIWIWIRRWQLKSYGSKNTVYL